MDAEDIFAQLVAQRGKVLASSYSRHSAYAHLTRAGFIDETGVVASIVCDDCNHAHDTAIVYQDSQYGYFCPDLGFLRMDRADLIAAQPRIAAFVAHVAKKLDCKRQKSTALSGDTWRIGALETAAGDVALYLQPTMVDAQDVADFESAVTREIRSSFGVILTSKGALSVPPYVTTCLQDVFRFDAHSDSFKIDVDLCAIAGVPKVQTGGRPSEHKEALTEVIGNRIANGTAKDGRNEEAKAVLVDYIANFPNAKPPALSTIKRYISQARTGS